MKTLTTKDALVELIQANRFLLYSTIYLFTVVCVCSWLLGSWLVLLITVLSVGIGVPLLVPNADSLAEQLDLGRQSTDKFLEYLNLLQSRKSLKHPDVVRFVNDHEDDAVLMGRVRVANEMWNSLRGDAFDIYGGR